MYYYLGIVYGVLDRPTEALTAFSRSLEIFPYHLESLFSLAQTYFKLDDFPAALEYCEKALKIAAEDFSNKKIRSLSILGDVNIDIRGFRNCEDPIRIKICSFIGDTRIIIPKGMKVKNRLKSLLGDYELVWNDEESLQSERFEESKGTCILEGFSILGDISIREEGSKKKGFLQQFFKGWNSWD